LQYQRCLAMNLQHASTRKNLLLNTASSYTSLKLTIRALILDNTHCVLPTDLYILGETDGCRTTFVVWRTASDIEGKTFKNAKRLCSMGLQRPSYPWLNFVSSVRNSRTSC